MKIAVQANVPADVAKSWDSEPNDRAPVKMSIAEAMGRIARTKDLIEWHEERMPDGSMIVTGRIDMTGPRGEFLPDYVLTLQEAV